MSKTRGKKSKGKKNDEDKESLAFKILSAETTKKLIDIEDVDELQEQLAENLSISHHSIDLKDGAVLDYFVAGLWWAAKEQSFSAEQTSSFFTVIHTLLDNVREKQMLLTDNLREFKKMLSGIGMEGPDRPGGGLETLFDVAGAKAVVDYVNISLFQHYKLYEFQFSHTQAEEILGTDLQLEVPPAASLPWPPPLEEAVADELYQQHIATPPASPGEKTEGEDQADKSVPAEGAEGAADEGGPAGAEAEADLLAKLSPEEVTSIMDSVFSEMLGGLKHDVAAKLREKENGFITRINKIHNVAS